MALYTSRAGSKQVQTFTLLSIEVGFGSIKVARCNGFHKVVKLALRVTALRLRALWHAVLAIRSAAVNTRLRALLLPVELDLLYLPTGAIQHQLRF